MVNNKILACFIWLQFSGISLEISQPGWIGSLRVAALYIAGVILGGLGSSCVEPEKYLVGASAGVYALVSSHLGQFCTKLRIF